MAARASSSGTISFGLVSIPVKVFTATSPKDVHFNMLHATDKSRLKQQLVCTTCGETVDRANTVRGYEHARGQYVVMTDDELAGLQKKTDQSIEIEEFVPISQVDPIHFERTQLLGPDKGGAKAYALLHRAMTQTGRVAIGRFSTRGRQQLVLIRPLGDGLALHGLFYADEVRSFDDIELEKGVSLRDAELELAIQLIDQLSHDKVELGKYSDEYRTAILEAIDKKVAGEEIVVQKPEEQREQIIDLVAALKQSLAKKAASGAAAEPAARGERKAAKPKGRKAAAG